MADIIDINVSKTTETITINSTPNLTTININTVTGGGGLVTSVNGDIGDVIVPVSDNNFTNALKTKLDGIAAGAEVNVNADWNATSGDAQILNKPTIPSISGLELQANKQNSLDVDGTGVKYPTVDAVNNGITNVNTNAIDKITVKLSTAINKGQAVYVSSADGTNIIVSKASNTSESTSSKTIGLLETTGTTNAIVNAVTDGLLTGLNTSTATIGDPVWLGTNGDLIYGLTNKPYAPAHLVYIGIVTRVNTNNGEILVKVQNGFELKEIHDVAINGVTDKQLLSYDNATSLWKNKSVTTADISDSTNKRYVTDANLTTIGNQSGTNTGDQDLSNLVIKNTAITGATKTKITYDAKGLVTAGADATTADIADSTNKRYQTDNQNSFNDATSSIQTQLNAKQNALSYTPYKYINTTSSTVTGTTAETIMATATISANTFNANDVMKILYEVSKSATISAPTFRVKINTTNSLSGATTIATYTFASANTYALIQRNFIISSGNLSGISFTASVLTDIASVTTVASSTSYNPANTLYLFFTLQLGNTADSTSFTMGNITN